MRSFFCVYIVSNMHIKYIKLMYFYIYMYTVLMYNYIRNEGRAPDQLGAEAREREKGRYPHEV